MRRLFRAYLDAAVPGYLGSIVVLTALVLAVPILAARSAGVMSSDLVLMALLALIPASDLAIALLNRSVTAIVPPSLLPAWRWRPVPHRNCAPWWSSRRC